MGANIQEIRTKVLIVDDTAANIIAIKTTIEHINIEILSADSGAEAISVLLRNDDVGLILMDVLMPGMDGFETAELIRQDDSIRHIPIIFITGENKEDKYMFRGYEAGAVDYLLKPLDSDVLIGKVKVFIQLHQQKLQMKQALDTIQKLQKEHELLLDNAGEGIVGLSEKGVVTFSNPAAEKILKYIKNDLMGKHFGKLVSQEKSDMYEKIINFPNKANDCEELNMEAIFIKSTGETFYVSCTKAVIADGNKVNGFVMLFHDISERKQAQARLEDMVQYDPLTKLANRVYFSDFLGKLLANAVRHNGSFALFCIDLDRFKQVNDTMGHDAGDSLLIQAASRLKAGVREGDLVCRLGGDEFAIILNFIDSPDVAATMAQRMLDSLRRPFGIKDKMASIGCSIGIAVYPGHGDTVDQLVKSADTAMYIAKDSGRDNFQFFHQNIQKSVEQHIQMADALKMACREKKLSLKYLPNCRFTDGVMVGTETVIHWSDSRYDRELTKALIDLSESYSFIDEIGGWMFIGACEHAKKVAAANIDDNPYYFSVTISGHQFRQKLFIENLRHIISMIGFDPQYLVLEFSEKTVMDNLFETITKFEIIRELRVRVTVFDVGTASAAIRALPNLPIYALKIDSGLVHDIGRHKNAEKIIQTIIGMAKSLGSQSIAEGVDTEEQMIYLKEQGCDLGQGECFTHSYTVDELASKLSPRR